MADIEKFSNQIIDYAERMVDVADAAKGKGSRHGGPGLRWMVLPAVGAGMYALATSNSFGRRTKDVMEQAKARASDLPEDLLNRVRQTSNGRAGNASAGGTQKRSRASNRSRRTSTSRRTSGSGSKSRSRASSR